MPRLARCRLGHKLRHIAEDRIPGDGLRVFEACGSDVADLGEEHGHRVLRVVGKGSKVVLVPLPPAVGRAIDLTVDDRPVGPILRTRRGSRMDRHAATRRLRRLAEASGMRMPRLHPHMLRHTFVTTMLDAGVDLRDVQIAARHADPPHHHALRPCEEEPRPAPQLHPRRLHGLRHPANGRYAVLIAAVSASLAAEWTHRVRPAGAGR